jgi:adenylate cyclase
VLFNHFKGFTSVAEKLSTDDLVGEIDHCFSNFDRIISNFKIEKIKTIGDAYTAAAGLPEPYNGHADQMVLPALEIRDFILNCKKNSAKRRAESPLKFASDCAVVLRMRAL